MNQHYAWQKIAMCQSTVFCPLLSDKVVSDIFYLQTFIEVLHSSDNIQTMQYVFK